jgi:catechol 2,3-dioxygenase-like lactoylglutathione lyase family enzyme
MPFVAVEEVVVPVADDAGTAAAVRFYVDVLRFEVTEETTIEAGEQLGITGGPAPSAGRSTTLRKTGATGGGLRVVSWESRRDPERHPTVHDAGPFAFTLFARGLRERLDEAAEAGFAHSGAHSYRLHGQDFTVTESLVAGPAGVNIALVEFQPDHHRCVLGSRPEELVSEIATAGLVVDDLEAALAVHRDALGATVYFDRVMDGPAVERMSKLDPGGTMRVAFLRGQARANARVELIERVTTRRPVAGRRGTFSLAMIVSDPEAVPGARVIDAGVALLDVAPGVVAELRERPRVGAAATR